MRTSCSSSVLSNSCSVPRFSLCASRENCVQRQRSLKNYRLRPRKTPRIPFWCYFSGSPKNETSMFNNETVVSLLPITLLTGDTLQHPHVDTANCIFRPHTRCAPESEMHYLGLADVYVHRMCCFVYICFKHVLANQRIHQKSASGSSTYEGKLIAFAVYIFILICNNSSQQPGLCGLLVFSKTMPLLLHRL